MLPAFNIFAYNRKISRSLTANIFLDFPEYYTPEKTFKKVNIKAFWLYFPKIIFKNAKDKIVVKRFIFFDESTMMPISIFDNYYSWEKKFESYFFYDYIKVIFYVKYSIRQKDDFLFHKYHLNILSKV